MSNIVAILVVVGIEAFKYVATPEADRYLSDFIVSLGTSLTKLAIATVGGILIAGVVGAALALTVGGVVVVALGAGFVLGWALDVLDNELGVTNALKDAFKNTPSQASDEIYSDVIIAP